MILSPVESSNLTAVGYNGSLLRLYIEFKRGSVYEYFGVPEQVARQIFESHSPGSTFCQLVRSCAVDDPSDRDEEFPYLYRQLDAAELEALTGRRPSAPVE